MKLTFENSSKNLRRLERRSTLQQRLPGFRVRMGFGLHYGWAVEGAIGSHLKIDASYLSPHVNMVWFVTLCMMM
jgi:class 3 adenylate cyclase